MSLLRISIAVVLCLAVLIPQYPAIREHQLYFTQDRRDVSLPFAELSAAWSEKTLRDRFPDIPVHCYPDPGEDLGDLGCVLDTKSINGVPALFISFFFSSGHLQQISINVPWWQHRVAYDYLAASIGPPSVSQLLPSGGVRLHGWRLPDGAAVFLNRDKSLNPLVWNAIYWRSAEACANNTCFASRTK